MAGAAVGRVLMLGSGAAALDGSRLSGAGVLAIGRRARRR
jgi:hypothetical protein